MADAASRGPANLDGEELIAGVSYTLFAHMVGSCAAPSGGAAASSYISVFDESGWRLTGDDPFWSQLGDGAAPQNLVHHLKEFVRKVYDAMKLDPEVLIMAFIYIEVRNAPLPCVTSVTALCNTCHCPCAHV
jgi:hypothetical protein